MARTGMMRGVAMLSIAIAVVVGWFVYDLLQTSVPETPINDVGSPVPDIDEIYDDFTSRRRTVAPAVGPVFREQRYYQSDYGCSLEDIYPGTGDEDDETEFRLTVARVAGDLEVSGNVEHVLSSVILSRSGGVFTAPDRIERALRLDPTNELVLWTADVMCENGADAGFCGDPDFLRNRDTILARNGAHWLRQAERFYVHGDESDVLEALERASTEPEFDTYFIDYVMLLERALAASSDMDYASRMTTAFAYTLQMPLEPTDILGVCPDQSATDSRWLSPCIRVSERLVSDGNTLLLKMIGLGYLERLYESSGQTEARDAVMAERDAWRQKLLIPNPDREIAMYSDVGFYAQYIDEFASRGEIAALEFANAELERRKQDPNYNPCENVPATRPTTGSGRE